MKCDSIIEELFKRNCCEIF